MMVNPSVTFPLKMNKQNQTEWGVAAPIIYILTIKNDDRNFLQKWSYFIKTTPYKSNQYTIKVLKCIFKQKLYSFVFALKCK